MYKLKFKGLGSCVVLSMDHPQDKPIPTYTMDIDVVDIFNEMPEKRLFVGILLRAFADAIGRVSTACKSERKQRAEIQAEAVLWFNSEDDDVGSLNWIIDGLNLSDQSIKLFRELINEPTPELKKRVGETFRIYQGQ
jgi:hypothetical protein